MYISADTIQTIKDSVSPSQAIEYYMSTTGRRGRYLCPFHSDRSPSMTAKNGHWECWSCHAKGDVIDFPMKYFGIGFRDAVTKLVTDFGISIEGDSHIDKEQAMWAQIQRESESRNRAEYRKYLIGEIDKLTVAHREMLQHGAPDWMLSQYAEEIDDLILTLEGR